VEADIAALRKDAGMWGGGEGSMEDIMQDAANTVDGLGTSATELSWVSTETGLLGTYDLMREKVGRLLTEGASNFDALCTALTRAADTYEGRDVENADAVRQAWQRKPR
jgi:hypothetical protein